MSDVNRISSMNLDGIGPGALSSDESYISDSDLPSYLNSSGNIINNFLNNNAGDKVEQNNAEGNIVNSVSNAVYRNIGANKVKQAHKYSGQEPSRTE